MIVSRTMEKRYGGDTALEVVTNMHIYKISMMVAGMALMAVAASGVAAPSATGEVYQPAAKLVPNNIRERGYFTMATDPTYAPFEYFTASNKMTGYDIDIIHAIASTLGLKVKIENITFASIIPGLQAGRYDLSMSSFSITPYREKVVDFVGPYYVGGAAIAVNKGNPLHVSSNPMSLCGHSVGAEKGTTESDAVLPYFSKQCVKEGKKPISVKVYTNQNQVNLALTSGRIQAQAADILPLNYMANHSNNNYQVIPDTNFFPTNYGIAIPKNSPFEPAIKAALHHIMGNGVLDKISSKWNVPKDTWKHPAKNYAIYEKS